MFGRLTRNGKLSPRRSTTFSNLLVEKRESVRVRACVCLRLWKRAPLKLLLTFPLWHHSVWCRVRISIHSNFLYFFIDFLFTCLWYAAQRMWCCNWQEKSLYSTLTWCFYLFYHFQNENRRQTKQLDFPLRHFPRYGFFRLHLCVASACLARIVLFAPYIHTECAALCLVFIFMHSEQ